jgi:hypothetical protein
LLAPQHYRDCFIHLPADLGFGSSRVRGCSAVEQPSELLDPVAFEHFEIGGNDLILQHPRFDIEAVTPFGLNPFSYSAGFPIKCIGDPPV